MNKIILIGDSIRLNYQPLVAAALTGRADVSGPEQNGGSSANVLKHLKAWVLDQAPDIVHLNCGLHDLRRDGAATTPLVSLAAFAENLECIFALLTAEAHCRVIWATITPVGEAAHGATRPLRRYQADVPRYNAAALEIARRHGAIINDLGSAVTDIGPDALLLPDGVHFTDAGYAFLATRVTAALTAALEE